MITTNRWLSALATIVLATAQYLTTRWLADDPTTSAYIGLLTTVVAGLLVPAAAAPVGTVDAGVQQAEVRAAKRMPR